MATTQTNNTRGNEERTQTTQRKNRQKEKMRSASAALIPRRGPQGPDKDSSNMVPGAEAT
jgi:hypothetical protein